MTNATRTIVLDSGDEKLELTQYRLSTLPESGEKRSQLVEQRKFSLGSSPENDFVLNDPAVSRHHALIIADDSGYRLRDLDSKNGTFLAGVRVQEGYLEDDITFRLGQTRMCFQMTSEETEVHLPNREKFGDLIGRSLEMRETFGLLDRVADTGATVLIEGESGTGKELAARAIHDHSSRSDKPFVVVDCSAIAPDLIESELFGHVEGAFTGATNDRQGAFQRADGGTLFLDELGELSLDLQPKLLRVLENNEVKPVGGDSTTKVDTRIVAATNRDLESEVEQGNFREDLFYRFAVIHVKLPPLRERPEDIPLLVEHFLSEADDKLGADEIDVSYRTMQKLKQHDWPGNVRELKNFVERAAVLSTGDKLETTFLKPSDPVPSSPDEASQTASPMAEMAIEQNLPFKDAKNRLVEEFEKDYWAELLARTEGNISEAARVAGVHRKSVEYILKKHDLSREELAE